jgi:hypothetical protein
MEVFSPQPPRRGALAKKKASAGHIVNHRLNKVKEEVQNIKGLKLT